MKYHNLPNSPLTLSALALGNGVFGVGLMPDATDRLYSLYRDAGGNTFDTAHCYSFWLPNGSGASERVLGRCIRRFNDRKNVFIITKGGHPAVLPDYPRPDSFLAPEIIASDINDSLERLGFDTIDLYLLHRDDPRMPVSGIIDTLNSHIATGRLRSIGVSNWTTARIAEANAYAQANGLHGFVVSQPQFSLAQPNAPEPTTDPANRYLYDHDIAWHTRSRLPVLCYSPTAGGYFASDGVRSKGTFENPTSRARLIRAQQLAAQLGATPNQIALAYLMAQPFLIIPILGTSDPVHLADGLASANIQLTPTQVRWLRDGERTTMKTIQTAAALSAGVSKDRICTDYLPFIDFHIHIRGGMTVEKAVERQAVTGISSGVLENLGVGWPLATDEQLTAFIDSAAGKPVFVGVQVNDRDWYTKHSPEALKRLDYVLADTMIMAMPDDDSPPVKLWMPELYDIENPDAWMERYMRHNLRVLSEPISILANPTYLPPAVKNLHDRLWTDARMRQIIQKAVEQGIALEIQANSEYPKERFIRMAKAMGAKFCFGSNNFDDKPIDMTRCLEMIEKFGLGKDDLFRPSCRQISSTPNTQRSTPKLVIGHIVEKNDIH